MFGNHVSKELSAYCNGELTHRDAQRVAGHLLRCRRCREEYQEIKLGVQFASRLSPVEAPSILWREVESLLDRREGGNRSEGARGWTIFRLRPFKFAAAGMALMLSVGLVALWSYTRQQQNKTVKNPDEKSPAWSVMRIDGQPKIAERQIGEKGMLAIGQWLVTDDSSRAQISVGEIGEVRVEPNSRIRLVEAREEEHRLALARGKMFALIWAPPRQFYVDTPSAVAVDLGCTYTLEVNDDGYGLLHVTSGWVAFEWEGRESFVPADAMCVTRSGLGPGTPYFSDASAAFQNALATFDTTGFDDSGRRAAIDLLLARSRKRDALTLWHMLARADSRERRDIYNRLARLIPPPKGVTREGVERADRAMLDAWWERLGLGDTDWWRMWKGPLPSQTK
jgi:FecR protein/Putative zinc-finger